MTASGVLHYTGPSLPLQLPFGFDGRGIRGGCPFLVSNPISRPNRWVGAVSVAATLSACGAGCALFDTGGWTAAGLAMGNGQTLLKPLSEAVPEALRLEYVILERPASDPLLGSELWDELVEMGIVDHNVRRSLNEQGLRVAVASTTPPQALQKLLGEAKEIRDEKSSGRRGHQMLLLPSGEHTEVLTGGSVESRQLKLTIDGKSVEKQFDDARGLIRVTAFSKQDGWATLEFLPEIHHGAQQMRPVAGDAGWRQFTTTQNVQKLYDQRFQLTLNEGDAAVITSLGDDPDRPGALFFRTTEDGVAMQRMLVVRLVETGESPSRGL